MVKAKEIAGLDCLGSATSGVVLVLRSRLEEMCEFRVASLDYSDIEGVHDMRVASRRLRSAMRDCKPYLRSKKLRRVRAYLKAVADALGAVRDEDVAILALEELKAEAPEEVIAGIDHLIAERAASREETRAVLAEAISEGTLARLQGEFIYSLERATKAKERAEADTADDADAERVSRAEPADAVPSFYQAGREIIAARLEELQSLGASLYQPFDTEPLHRMRIAAKRLRYAIELFALCWGETLLPFAKDVASMQSHLGQVHDCDEWIDALGERLGAEPVERDEDEAEGDVEVEKEKRRAVFWLLGHFTKVRTKHYCSALERFAKWEENGCATNLIAILEREPEPAVEQPQPVEQRPAPSPEPEPEAIDASVPTQV
jgi:CHAD domain-containing protein